MKKNRRWRDLTAGQKAAVAAAAAVQLALAATAWTDLARRAPAEVRGPKWRWAGSIAVNYIGPVAYFCWGRRRAPGPGLPSAVTECAS